MRKLALLALLITMHCCVQAKAQTFSLATGRQPVVSLDGLWRFHIGDNPAWAQPGFDDSHWQLLRSDESWSAQGYKGYAGFAWYRFTVQDDQGTLPLSLFLTEIFTSYRVYADGTFLGGFGDLPPNFWLTLSRPLPAAYNLPLSGAPGPRVIHIAIRVWHDPKWAQYVPGGARQPGNVIGQTSLILKQARAQTVALAFQGANVYAYSVVALLFGVLVLCLYFFRPAEREYLWFALVLLSSGADAALSIVRSLSVLPIQVLDFAEAFVFAVFHVAALLFFSLVFRARRGFWWRIACIAAILETFSTFTYVFGLTPVPVSNAIEISLLLPSQLWILAALIRRAAQKDIDARLLLLPVFIAFGFAGADNLAVMSYQFGWQRRILSFDVPVLEHPYPLRLRAIVFAVFAFAMMLFLIRRFYLARRAEERFSAEVQAARSVQQYLIPDHLPLTPGLVIASEYRPAREVGGDFFQVLFNEADGSTLIVVGDVAGHGMESGMLATLIVGAIRTAVAFTFDPERILVLLNERLQGRGLVTCLALRLEPNGSATLVNTGHLPPFLNDKELAVEGALPLGAALGICFPVSRFTLAPPSAIGATVFLLLNAVGMWVVVEFIWTVQAFPDRIFRAAAHLCWICLTIGGVYSSVQMHPGISVTAGMLTENWFVFLFNVIIGGAQLVALAGRGRNRPIAAAMLLISIFYFLGIAGYTTEYKRLGVNLFIASFDLSSLFIAVLLMRQTWTAWRRAEDLRVEFAAARELQQELVPIALPALPGWRVEAAYLPAAEVGGDFYHIVEQHEAAILLIGDVSGKGLKAAMTGLLTIGAASALASEFTGPAQLLTRLNREMVRLQKGGFVTCLCARIGKDGALTIANAGHLAPYRNGEEVRVDNGLPLGIAPDEAYAETILQLSPDDQLTFLSDGIVEAKTPTGELFGFDRTRALSTQSAEAIAQAAQQFGQEDDITVLTLNFVPSEVTA